MILADDKYIVSWHDHIARALEAKHWCHETFGDAWGDVALGVPNGIGIGKHLFKFHRLNHANWFMLKYNNHFDNNS